MAWGREWVFGMKWLLSKFRNDDRGNATVEFVLWLPLIMGIVVGSFDLNIMLMTQNNMYTVARDTARRVSTGDMTAAAAKAYALKQLNYMGFDYGVDITDGTDVVVAINTTLSNVAVLGVMGGEGSYALKAKVTMRSEQ